MHVHGLQNVLKGGFIDPILDRQSNCNNSENIQIWRDFGAQLLEFAQINPFVFIFMLTLESKPCWLGGRALAS